MLDVFAWLREDIGGYMRNSLPSFVAAMLLLVFSVAWLNSFLLAKWFEVYRRPFVRRGYWFTTLVAGVVLMFIWAIRTIPGMFDYNAFRELAYATFAWIIGQVVLFVLLPLIFLAHKATQSWAAQVDTVGGDISPAMGRRAFLQKAAAATPVMAFGISAQGLFDAETNMVVTHHDIPVVGLPSELEGFKVAQISDTHLGAFFPLSRLEKVVQLLKAERMDLLAITGDLVDDLSLLDRATGMLAEYAAGLPYGAYFCWGNHEYYRDIGRIRNSLVHSGIKVLENSGDKIGKGARPLYIAGVDFPWTSDSTAQTAKRTDFFTKAMQSAPPNAVKLLLSHHPNFLFEAFQSRIDLTLSGHTHGGQVCFFDQPVLPLRYPYYRGLYRSGSSFGYVNSGTGHWFPFRLGCPPEVSVFRLCQAKY